MTTLRVSFLYSARQDVKEALEWYESQQKGLGGEFLDEVEQALQLIESMPTGYPIKYRFLRAKLVNRFPYALFYRLENESHIRIYACLHLSRNLANILKTR